MRKRIIVGSYWLGTLCAAMALLTRSLDVLGMNFIDFNTRGGGIGYHSLMDGTLFFYAISIGNASYDWFVSQQPAGVGAQKDQRSLIARTAQDVSTWSYWVGSLCAAMALFARSLDVLGMNFIDFNTRGGGIGYHSLMDGTLFFYAISIGNVSYHWLVSQQPAVAAAQNYPAQDGQRVSGVHATEELSSNT